MALALRFSAMAVLLDERRRTEDAHALFGRNDWTESCSVGCRLYRGGADYSRAGGLANPAGADDLARRS